MTSRPYEALTRPLRVGARLAEVLGDERWADLRVELVAGGKSNLTFELISPAGSLILRRPPSGPLLPRAHDMGREARVQRALAASAVPVASIVLEDDGAILGVPFYVMGKVEGHVLAGALPAGFAETGPERAALCHALIDTLADLHELRPEQIGLGDFGRPAGYMHRQIRTWSRQWEASKTHDVPAVDELMRRLQNIAFTDPDRPTVLHGDYRLGNCILDAADPSKINAVLDWELSTLGDPLADLGMLLFYWSEPGDPPAVLTSSLTSVPGFLSRAELAERYAHRTGRDVAALARYTAFAHFKFAVIAQGVATRAANGAMAGQDFGDLDAEILRIATAGLDQLEH